MATDTNIPTGVRVITASDFKAKCLKLMDEVLESGGGDSHHQAGPPRLAADAVPGEAESPIRPG